MTNKTAYVDTGWTDEGDGDPVIRVFISGLHPDTDQTVGWPSLPTIEQTDSWFGLTVDEARDVYFGLGIMLGEYDEAELGQS